MVPGGLYFRKCVASASADTTSFPLPHGRGGDCLPARRQPGVRAANESRPGWWASHLAQPLRKAHSLTARIKPPPHAFGNDCVPFPARHLAPNKHRLHLCPPTAPRRPVTSLPTRPPIPHPRGNARLLSRVHDSVGSRQGQCLSAAKPPTPGLTLWTVASSRRARRECPLPTTTRTSLPGPLTHLQPTAAAGTSRGGQQESRREPAAADSSRLAVPALQQTSSL